jgi:hypothetical protein
MQQFGGTERFLQNRVEPGSEYFALVGGAAQTGQSNSLYFEIGLVNRAAAEIFEQQESALSGSFDFTKKDMWGKIDTDGGVIWAGVAADLGPLVRQVIGDRFP